jgi:hypothetical protein
MEETGDLPTDESSKDARKSTSWSGAIAAWADAGKNIMQGGLAQLLLSKPVVETITKIVGSEYAERRARKEGQALVIRTEAEAQAKIISAVANVAAKQASKDPALADRAVIRAMRNSEIKQENIESVAFKALQYLSDDPPPPDQTSTPSDDFLNYFGDHAERASEENLRDMFARILAGEIRQPGTIRRQTIHVVSLMDQEIAKALTRTRAWLHDTGFPNVKPLHNGEPFLAMGVLEDLSLVRDGVMIDYSVGSNGEIFFPFIKYGVVYTTLPNSTLRVNSWSLTPIGRQVMRLIETNDDIDMIERISMALAVKSNEKFSNHAGKISRVDLVNHQKMANGRYSLGERKTIWQISSDLSTST